MRSWTKLSQFLRVVLSTYMDPTYIIKYIISRVDIISRLNEISVDLTAILIFLFQFLF